jgi:hypothetical protein
MNASTATAIATTKTKETATRDDVNRASRILATRRNDMSPNDWVAEEEGTEFAVYDTSLPKGEWNY